MAARIDDTSLQSEALELAASGAQRLHFGVSSGVIDFGAFVDTGADNLPVDCYYRPKRATRPLSVLWASSTASRSNCSWLSI